MKTNIIHSPYYSYNREKGKWEWVIEIYSTELKKLNFNTKEEAEEFKRRKG